MELQDHQTHLQNLVNQANTLSNEIETKRTLLLKVQGLIEESVAKIDIYAGSVNGANTTISSSMWNGSGMYVAGTYHILGY